MPITTTTQSAVLVIESGSYENIYSGYSAVLIGTCSSKNITATAGTVNWSGSGPYNFNWVLKADTTRQITLYCHTTAKTFIMKVIPAPPSLTIDNKVITLTGDRVTNTGTFSGSLAKPAVGSMSTSQAKFTWTASKTALTNDNFVNGLLLSTTSSDKSKTTRNIFFIEGGTSSPQRNKLTFRMSVPMPLSDNGAAAFAAAAGYTLGIDPSMVAVSFPIRRMLAASGSTEAIVTIDNLSKSLADQLSTEVNNAINSGAFIVNLAQTAYSAAGSVVSLLSQPVVVDSNGNVVSTSSTLLPLWLLILIIVGATLILGATLTFCCSRCCKTSKPRGTPQKDIIFPKSYNRNELYDDDIAPTEPTTEPLPVDIPRSAVLLKTIFLRIMPSGETLSIDIYQNDTVRDLKERLMQNYPQYTGYDISFLFGGKKLSEDLDLGSGDFVDGTVVYVICQVKKTLSGSNNSSNNSPPIGVGEILNALARRADKNLTVRLDARRVLSSIGDRDLVNETVKSLMEEETNIVPTKLPNDDHSWLPLDDSTPDTVVFDPKTARELQRTDDYTLIGKVMDESAPENQRGLVRPLNVHKDGIEGVNSIVWQAVVGSKSVVLKGLLPFSNMDGYEQQFTLQDPEYRIPMSIPRHPNVIPILHQFTGSSSLIIPWISADVLHLNEQIQKSTGKRFIRRLTTYVVMEHYPSTLRKYLKDRQAKNEVFTERELCFTALQLLKALVHLKAHKVCHRDIKDDNIFRTSDGLLVLADFGCALSCDGMVYQKVEDLTTRIGSVASTAPEVHMAIKTGPAMSTPQMLWDVMCQNDVYAVGALLYRMVGIEVPNVLAPYSVSAILPLPSGRFSAQCDRFLRSLVAYDPAKRLTAETAVERLQYMLWGPSDDISSDEASISSWLLERRLDLVFNCVDKSPKPVQVGSVIPRMSWPPKAGIERNACSQFLQQVTTTDIARARQAEMNVSSRRLTAAV